MALSDITQKILDDARKDAEITLENAKDRVAQIKGETEKKLKELQVQQDEKLQHIKDQTKQERVSLYKQRIKNLIDKKKRGLLDGVFADALKALHKKTDAEVKEFVQKALSMLPSDLKDVHVFVNAQQATILKPVVEKFFPDAVIKTANDIQGGCIVRAEEYEYDLTFEAILEDKRKDLEVEVARMMFEEIK